jgi:hypothetical protein
MCSVDSCSLSISQRNDCSAAYFIACYSILTDFERKMCVTLQNFNILPSHSNYWVINIIRVDDFMGFGRSCSIMQLNLYIYVLASNM